MDLPVRCSRWHFCRLFGRGAAGAEPPSDLPPFPRPTDSYNDEDVADIWQRLAGRVAAEPFNLVATVIFVLAICHTFLASKFLAIAHHYEREYDALENEEEKAGLISEVARRRDDLRFRGNAFPFSW